MHGLFKEYKRRPPPAEVANQKLTRPPQGAAKKRNVPMPASRQSIQIESVSSCSDDSVCDTFAPESRSGVSRINSDTRHNGDDVRERLAEELETEIIPRLLLAHGGVPRAVFGEETLACLEKHAQARELARIAVEDDTSAVAEYIDKLVLAGSQLETVLTDILAGAARDLGRQWERDELDFMQVTIGVSNLQLAFRGLLLEHPTAFTNGNSAGLSAAFVAAGGEQHTFGLLILEEIFRCRGWTVRSSVELDCAHLMELAAREPIDLVGFSLAVESRLDHLKKQISSLRSASISPDLVIIVGGHVFLDNPELWKSTGADGSAPDAIEALLVGEKLVRARQMSQQSSA